MIYGTWSGLSPDAAQVCQIGKENRKKLCTDLRDQNTMSNYIRSKIFQGVKFRANINLDFELFVIRLFYTLCAVIFVVGLYKTFCNPRLKLNVTHSLCFL